MCATDEYDDIISFCDIYECSDCPRCGDDCDGRADDEEVERCHNQKQRQNGTEKTR